VVSKAIMPARGARPDSVGDLREVLLGVAN
jgi:hypothetical protein